MNLAAPPRASVPSLPELSRLSPSRDLIRLIGARKVYGSGEAAVTRARRHRPCDRERRVRRRARALGLGQVHGDEHPGLPRYADWRALFLPRRRCRKRSPATQRALLRRYHIGFVFQGFNLLKRTTALENLELPLHLSRHAEGRTAASRAPRAGAGRTVGPREAHRLRAFRRPAAARRDRARARHRPRGHLRRRADRQSRQRQAATKSCRCWPRSTGARHHHRSRHARRGRRRLRAAP